MISGLWEAAYLQLFDDGHSQINMPTLGANLSHGYLACGFLPLHNIAFSKVC